uniref:Uncharacterized protein n=1 Tax=Romanomermis culicivorax TaxID=13658 RepID=A0A915JLL8_ROMCU
MTNKNSEVGALNRFVEHAMVKSNQSAAHSFKLRIASLASFNTKSKRSSKTFNGLKQGESKNIQRQGRHLADFNASDWQPDEIHGFLKKTFPHNCDDQMEVGTSAQAELEIHDDNEFAGTVVDEEACALQSSAINSDAE